MNLFEFACDNLRLQAKQVQEEPAAEIPPFLWQASPRDRMAGLEAEIVSEGRAHVNTRPNRKTD